MKKILSIFAAALVAIAVNAQTDFSTPYSCTADDAVLSGTATEHAGKFYLDQSTETHYIAWSDCPVEGIDEGGYTNLVTWTVEATRACYISVSLDLGPVIASNKHIFQVKVLDAEEHEIAYLAEPGENADANQVKELNGKVFISEAGTYKVQLTNHRSFCKGTIKNVILTYAGAAPITDFSTPYSCTADDAVLSGTATEHAGKFYLDQSTETHYIAWSDCPVEGIDEGGYTNLVTWTVKATRACCISVSLDLGPVIASNKHIFQVKVLDAEEHEIAYLAEPGENADANQVKELSGIVLIPAAGTYMVQLTNHRSFCKGTIKNVILTYAEDIKAMYLNPNIWDVADVDEKFAVWDITHSMWCGFMAAVEGENNLYQIAVPASTEKLIYARINGDLDAPKWNNDEETNNVWNQTPDLTIPEGQNLYTITGWGGDDKISTGEWSKYETETSIHNTAVEAKAVKMMHNGQLVIIKNGVKYNVLGTAL